MKIVLIGSGGREHALAYKLSQSDLVESVVVIPGNSGMTDVADTIPVEWSNVKELAGQISRMEPDLVIVGSEGPLADGIVNELAEFNIPAFGPTKDAARIESSKVFAKNLLVEYGIPTAKFESFTEVNRAIAYLTDFTPPYVIKADGLAAGKGVMIAQDEEEAAAAIRLMLEDEAFGKAGKEIVVEEFMEGQEASLLAFVDGEKVVPMIPAQDHKRLGDGDTGPNTGGMGAFAPADVLTPALYKEAVQKILIPTAKALVNEGCPFRGILYAGLMITDEGPKVVEFNCRFGDPETQVLLPLLDSDLAEIISNIMAGRIDDVELKWLDAYAVCVVAASFGYPKKTYRGDLITGIEDAQAGGALVFHAGTRNIDGQCYTDGGRVLNVVAVRPTLQDAKDAAYAAMKKIKFEGMQYRTDIADKGLLRK